MSDEPVLVEATRGDLVESSHRGSVAVVDAGGKVVLSLGDIDRPVYPRSAIKPLQALPLLETGAAEAFGLGDVELALACASHGGTARQARCVAEWLGRVGLTEADLACGCQSPSHGDSRKAMIRSGAVPTALHNNCSGKHAGMLTTAVHCGDVPKGYLASGHPVQQRVFDALTETCDVDVRGATAGIDGCGIPVVAMPLSAIARGMARFASPVSASERRVAATTRLRQAMAAEPELVAWDGHLVTDVLRTTNGRVIVKNGAEGVFCAALPALGLGVALKIADGASRAAEVAIMGTLVRLGALQDAEQQALAERLRVPLRNWAGTLVGSLRPGAVLLPG